METKKCSKCGEIKEVETGFSKDKNRKSGFTPQCKACVSAYAKAHNATPERKVALKAYYESPERQAMIKARRETPEFKAKRRAEVARTRADAEVLLSPDRTCMYPGCHATESHGKSKALQFHEINGREEGATSNWWIKASKEDPGLFKKTTQLLCKKHHFEVHGYARHSEIIKKKEAEQETHAQALAAKDLTIAKLTTLVIALYAQLKKIKET